MEDDHVQECIALSQPQPAQRANVDAVEVERKRVLQALHNATFVAGQKFKNWIFPGFWIQRLAFRNEEGRTFWLARLVADDDTEHASAIAYGEAKRKRHFVQSKCMCIKHRRAIKLF